MERSGRAKTAHTRFDSARTSTGVGVNDIAPEPDSNNQPITGTSISLEQYRRTLLFGQMGYSAAELEALGGGASQFSISGGNPYAHVGLTGGDAFIQDDWKIRPNLTIGPGLRFEQQTQQHNSIPIRHPHT